MAAIKEEKMEGGRRGSEDVTPPEGGWGWIIVAGCFLATICIRAVTRCVSMFFVEFQMHFEKDYSSTAWIHSLIDCMTMLCAPLGGFLVNRLSCRATVILGGVLSSAGLVLSSFATRLEHLGIGTFVLAPAVQMLIEQYSWRGALLVLGGFVSNLCVCGAVMRPLEPRKGGRLWENRMANLEKDCMTTVLDSKGSEHEPKQLEMSNLKETEGLLISNGAIKNFDKLGQGHITLLSNTSLSDPGLKDLKIAQCMLFSNRLTETVLGGIELSDPSLANESTTEDLKTVESMNLNNKAADTNAKAGDSGFSETKIIDDFHLGDSLSPAPEPLPNKPTKTLSKLCHKSREEFGFLALPDFLILAVSFLFMAYGCSAPVVYLIPYALSVGVEPKHAAFLMSIFGISGIVGNITFGWITDRKCLKRYRILSYMLAIGMEGLCCMFIPLLHSFPLLVCFSVLYGYFDGAYVTLIPVVTSDIVGSSYLTAALGMVYFLHAIPYLVSPPIGGWLVDQTGNYAATFFLSGASFLFSAVVLAAAILVKKGRRSRSNSAVPLSPDHPAAAAQRDVI